MNTTFDDVRDSRNFSFIFARYKYANVLIGKEKGKCSLPKKKFDKFFGPTVVTVSFEYVFITRIYFLMS